jgi:hypothetical protein
VKAGGSVRAQRSADTTSGARERGFVRQRLHIALALAQPCGADRDAHTCLPLVSRGLHVCALQRSCPAEHATWSVAVSAMTRTRALPSWSWRRAQTFVGLPPS